MIEYELVTNELTGEPKKYKAQVVNSRSYTFDDIAKRLIKHNVGLSPAAIYGLWESIKEAVVELISDGKVINTELFHANISIKGVFDGMEDGFNRNRHEIRLNLWPGSILRDIPKTLKVKKLNCGAKSMILSVTDIKTGSVNSILTPGKDVRIIGQRIKVNGDNQACGLYFSPAKNPEKAVKIDASELVVNNPSEIIAVIPNLGKEIWNLMLITQYSPGHGCLKTPRSIIFDKDFIIA